MHFVCCPPRFAVNNISVNNGDTFTETIMHEYHIFLTVSKWLLKYKWTRSDVLDQFCMAAAGHACTKCTCGRKRIDTQSICPNTNGARPISILLRFVY